MKDTELSIGDWVEYEGYHCRVEGVVEDKEGGSYIFVHDILGNVMVDDLQPIPLTAEILEKNGFEWMEENIEYLLPLGNNMEVRAEVVDDFRWDITVYSINADINFYEFEYVHQLQHALRLCGIEKEVLI